MSYNVSTAQHILPGPERFHLRLYFSCSSVQLKEVIFLPLTLDIFIIAGDVLQPGEAHGFGADERPHSLRVHAAADHAAPAHHARVDVGVHLGVDKGDVVEEVDTPLLDGLDGSRAAAEHACGRRKRHFGFQGDGLRQGGSAALSRSSVSA